MQIEQLFYWVSDREWWIGASQGAVGALIGFLGLYVAYKLTQSWEKNKHKEQRVMEGAASVIQSTLAVIEASPDNSQKAKELGAELILFCARESVDHPLTADWAVEHGIYFSNWANRPNSSDLLMDQAGTVGGDLMRWIRKERQEGELDPKGVEEEWNKAIESAGLQKKSSGDPDAEIL